MTRNLSRAVSLLLSLVLVISLIPTALAYTGVSGWAEEKVAAMDKLGLIPDSLDGADLSQVISRLEMVRIAVAAYEKRSGNPIELPAEHPFSDTTDPAAEKAHAAGLTAGNGSGQFLPDASLTRLEFFSFAVTMLRQLGYPITEQDYADLSRFDDAASIPSWGYENARIAVGLGVTAGNGKSLAWASTASRQEAICMFYQVYQLAASMEQPEPTEPSVPETQPSEPTAPSEPSEPSQPTEPTVPETPAKPPLKNLSGWAEDKVRYLDNLGILPDEVREQPMDGLITRQNMCKVTMRAYKQLKGLTDADLGDPGQSPFSDTSDWDVLHANRLGIVSGTGDGKFSPDEPITRQDFFTISVAFLGALGFPEKDDPSVDLSIFSDADQISSYAVAPTRLLVGMCRLSGSDGKLMPLKSIVCQEALCIFYQIHRFYLDWSDPERQPDGIDIAEFALQFVGYPYAYGGKSPEQGFDCSGFVYYIYKQFGYELLPGADRQWNSLPDEIIPKDQLMPGDLVFFSEDGTVDGISHVAIYIGGMEMVHASNPRKGVCITDMNTNDYVRRYFGAKRVVG